MSNVRNTQYPTLVSLCTYSIVIELELCLITSLYSIILTQVSGIGIRCILLCRNRIVNRSRFLSLSIDVQGIILSIFITILADSHGHSNLTLAFYYALIGQNRRIA